MLRFPYSRSAVKSGAGAGESNLDLRTWPGHLEFLGNGRCQGKERARPVDKDGFGRDSFSSRPTGADEQDNSTEQDPRHAPDQTGNP
jgi:hypothetical protein